MNHLSPETLLDLAEGTRADQSEPHLADCDRCREALTDLRAAWSASAQVEVPEPSPLFWDHLSARIRAAVEQEGHLAPKPWALLMSPWRITALAAVGVAMFAAILTFGTVPDRHDTTDRMDMADQASLVEPPLSLSDDPSLSLIVDLAGGLEWDDAAEAGLTVRGDGVEQAVRDLSDEERVELRRVLREAIDDARAGGKGV
jgi:hypothetical protein